MRVATFNLHAGVDGWGRPTRALDHAARLGADLLVLPETWRGDHGDDFVTQFETLTGATVTFAPLARAERVTTGHGGPTWQPLSAHLTGEHGLFFPDFRSPTRSQRRHRSRVDVVETGQWGLAVASRLPLTQVEIVDLGRLPRERVSRAAITATVSSPEGQFTLIALHGAHLSHGSYRLYARVNELAATFADHPVLLVGDFNSWRPTLRAMLPGWRTLARGRTWPARFPHSQIDHILGRGPWHTTRSFTSAGGSDHRALVAELTLAPRGLG